MPSPMQNFLANLTQMVGLIQNQRQLEQRQRMHEDELELQRRGQQLGSTINAAQLLQNVAPEARAPILALLEGQGLRPEALAALSTALPESTESIRQRMTAAGAGAIAPQNVAARELTGSATLAPLAEDALLSSFLSGGIQQQPNMLGEFLSQRLTGMNRGQAAQSSAVAGLPPEILEQGARISLGTLLSAPHREQARQADQQLGLGYQQLQHQRQVLAENAAQFDAQLMLQELEATKEESSVLTPDQMLRAMATLSEVNDRINKGGQSDLDRTNDQIMAYRLMITLGYPQEEARKLSGLDGENAKRGMSTRQAIIR